MKLFYLNLTWKEKKQTNMLLTGGPKAFLLMPGPEVLGGGRQKIPLKDERRERQKLHSKLLMALFVFFYIQNQNVNLLK